MKDYDNKLRTTFSPEQENEVLKFLYENKMGRGILKILINPKVTKSAAFMMNSHISVLKINSFIENNNINMSEYEKVKYKSFNDFFTRKIKSGKRPIDECKDHLISPCDSKLSAYKINEQNSFFIKQSWYSVEDLIGDESLADKYNDGYCLVFRLEANDYHHYCYIDNGSKKKNIYIQGKFHTVQPIALRNTPVFKQNSREYTVMETENFGTVVQVEVGALLVGKIKNLHQEYNFKKGEEKGMFEFGGSTIVLLLQKDSVIIDNELFENTQNELETVVKLGERIGCKK